MDKENIVTQNYFIFLPIFFSCKTLKLQINIASFEEATSQKYQEPMVRTVIRYIALNKSNDINSSK